MKRKPVLCEVIPSGCLLGCQVKLLKKKKNVSTPNTTRMRKYKSHQNVLVPLVLLTIECI